MREWLEIKRLVGAALECSPEEREAFLLAHAADPGTREAALALLRANDAAGEFLRDPTISARETPMPLAIGPIDPHISMKFIPHPL